MGTWSSGAIKEAKFLETVVVVHLKKIITITSLKYSVPADAYYCTSNNTIFVTNKSFPTLDMPVVCDMSSDIFLEF
jgi:phosphoserine aminotransferase